MLYLKIEILAWSVGVLADNVILASATACRNLGAVRKRSHVGIYEHALQSLRMCGYVWTLPHNLD